MDRHLTEGKIMVHIPTGADPGESDQPSVEQLPAVEGLPDPFNLNDGTRVTDHHAWLRRRVEIKEMLLHYQYGHLAPPPDNLESRETSSKSVFGGGAEERRVTLLMGPRNAVKVRISLLFPPGQGPFPVILKNDRDLGQVPIAKEIVDRGYIVAEYVRHDLDDDNAIRTDGVHPIYPECDWGTLAAWAWGGMRVIDYLTTLEVVDNDKIAITGHSRGGKTALLAGALDDRIAISAPNGSGTGGAGCYRVQGEGAETLSDILRAFQYWFHPRLAGFVGREAHLPFDQHFLRALVAPRAVISIDALGDRWANPLGTCAAHAGSQSVFDWLGAGDKNGIHFRQGGHAQSEEDWRALVDFADLVFFDKEPASGRKFDTCPFPDEPKAFSWNSP
jgi:hypothetical protein